MAVITWQICKRSIACSLIVNSENSECPHISSDNLLLSRNTQFIAAITAENDQIAGNNTDILSTC